MSLRSFLNEKVIEPILAQIKQGVTPRKLALSIAFGVALGIFPVIGVSILLCLLIGIPLKLNQPALQAVNLLMYPFQIPLVLVFAWPVMPAVWRGAGKPAAFDLETPVVIGFLLVSIMGDRKSTRLNSSHGTLSRMPSSA